MSNSRSSSVWFDSRRRTWPLRPCSYTHSGTRPCGTPASGYSPENCCHIAYILVFQTFPFKYATIIVMVLNLFTIL